MSGIFSTPTLSPSGRAKRGAALAALGAILLAGCGGGGGDNGNNNGSFGNNGGFGTTGTVGTTGANTGSNTGSNTGGAANASVIGKVVDTQGQGVPGVSLNVDTGGVLATTLSQGGYRLDNLTGNVVHRITAAVTRPDNVTYSGSTQVLTQSNLLVSNANILLSRSDRQATVSGTVLDGNNNPVPNAEVFLAVPNNANYSSLIAYTDRNGNYTITNIPTDLPSAAPITIAASAAGAQNQTFTLRGLQVGGGYNQNFQLNGATGQAVNAPNILSVSAFTQPSSALTGSARTAHGVAATDASLYEHLRRLISPAYAQFAARPRAAGRRLTAHVTGSYAIETDIAFDAASQSNSLLGYYVYRSVGTTTPRTGDTSYDFLADPLASFYSDLTFAGEPGASGPYGQYNYALTAANTNNTQSGLSAVYSVVPLGPLTLVQPTPGQGLANNVILTWNPVSGASRYYVFVYNQYPTADIAPIFSIPASPGGTALPGTVSTYALPGPLQRGNTYYAVIAGAGDQTEIAGAPLVTNAAVTLSPITRFYVQ